MATWPNPLVWADDMFDADQFTEEMFRAGLPNCEWTGDKLNAALYQTTSWIAQIAACFPIGGTAGQFLTVDAEGNWVWADLPNSTTTQRGIVELATNAEAIAGTDTERALTPAALRAVLDGESGSSGGVGEVVTVPSGVNAVAIPIPVGLSVFHYSNASAAGVNQGDSIPVWPSLNGSSIAPNVSVPVGHAGLGVRFASTTASAAFRLSGVIVVTNGGGQMSVEVSSRATGSNTDTTYGPRAVYTNYSGVASHLLITQSGDTIQTLSYQRIA